jgi:hypothetical protein
MTNTPTQAGSGWAGVASMLGLRQKLLYKLVPECDGPNGAARPHCHAILS